MGVNARQIKGDSRTEELAAKNDLEIQPVPEEIERWADENIVYLRNVSPYAYKIDHPSIGSILIPACKEGSKFSEAAEVRGMIPFGVRQEMNTVEIRHDSGRLFALDLIGVGPGRSPKDRLSNVGVFLCTGDTLDLDDLVAYKTGRVHGKDVFVNVPRWVKTGKNLEQPTAKELAEANRRFAEWDFAKIAEADGYHDAGPQVASTNIGREHREALRRRGQRRSWDMPNETLTPCEGCGQMVSPAVVVHTCGAVFNWDKAIALGIKKEEDRPKKIA